MQKVTLFQQVILHIVILVVNCRSNGELITDEIQARMFLEEFNRETQIKGSQMAELNWIYNTNLTDYNRDRMVSFMLVLSVINVQC